MEGLPQDVRSAGRQLFRRPDLAAALTSYLPARRAARIDPMVALRAE